MKALRDPTLWGVIAGNVFAIGMAITENWSASEILWTYWAQSVLIGIINAYRMWTLGEFTTDGLTSGGNAVPETVQAKKETTGFFIFHYGFFHFCYAIFLASDLPLNLATPTTSWTLALAISGFVFAHIYSYRHNRLMDFRDKKPNLGFLLFYPYIRIIPMHLIIVSGMFLTSGGMVLFMAMKTVADALMHIIERRLFRRT